MVGGVAFFVGFQGTNVRFRTNVSFLHKVSSLHICPQKNAMNALPYVIGFIFIIINQLHYQFNILNLNIINRKIAAKPQLFCFLQFYNYSTVCNKSFCWCINISKCWACCWWNYNLLKSWLSGVGKILKVYK